MSKLDNLLIETFSIEQRQSKTGMLVIFFDKFIKIVKNFLVLLIIPMINDFDIVFFIITILITALISAVITFIDFKYFTFQFDFDKNDFIIKKGFFKKTKLSVPLSKIQQINLNQNFIHKILNLYEIQMDTAGSDSKEVSIKAVDKNIALDIKKFTDFLKNNNSKIEIKKTINDDELEIDFFTLIKIGLTSRYFQTLGFIAALFFGALEYLNALNINIIPSFSSFIKSGNFGFVAILIYTVIKFYRFSAKKLNNNLTVSYGLISSKTILMSPNKVQVFSYTQNWIQNKIDLCNIVIYQASSSISTLSEKSNDGSKVYIPGANSFDRKKIFQFIYKSNDKNEILIKPNIRKFFVNLFLIGILPSAILFTLNYFFNFFETINYLVIQLIFIMFSFLISYRLYKNSFLSISENFIKVQSGFWDIKTRIIEIHKIQSIVIDQDIWYKRLNLADLTICTAGGMIRFSFIDFKKLKLITDNLIYKVEISNKSWM